MVKNPSAEQQRRIPLKDGQNNRCHVTRRKEREKRREVLSVSNDVHGET